MYQNTQPQRRGSAQYNNQQQPQRRQSTPYNNQPQWSRPDYRPHKPPVDFEPVTYSGGNAGLVNYPANGARSPTPYDYNNGNVSGWSDPSRQNYSTPGSYYSNAQSPPSSPIYTSPPPMMRRFSTNDNNGMSNAEMVAAAIKARASMSSARFAIRRKGEKNSGESNGLYSVQTFSVEDPRFMQFGPIRVFNEDRLAPGAGYGSNLHRDFEIINYVVSGDSLSHRDSSGTNEILPTNGVLLVTTGTGIMHSVTNVAKNPADEVVLAATVVSPPPTPSPPSMSRERTMSATSLTSASSATESNGSSSSPGTNGRSSPESSTGSAGHLLQVWVKPWTTSIKPGSSVKPFKTKEKRNKLLPMVIPHSEEDQPPTQLFHGIPYSRLVRVHQDLYMFACALVVQDDTPEPKVVHRPLGTDRKLCVHVLDIPVEDEEQEGRPAVVVNDAVVLAPGDTVFVDRASIGDRIEIKRANGAIGKVEVVLFDVAASEQHWAKA